MNHPTEVPTRRDLGADLPAVTEDWARFNASLMVGALEYALYGLGQDRERDNRQGLAAAVDVRAGGDHTCAWHRGHWRSCRCGSAAGAAG